MIKCGRCGTEYNFPPCPTCERNRLLEEQNRKSEERTRELQKQNRLLEDQNKETARLRDEQERQNQQREQQYEREEERRRQEQEERRNQELEERRRQELAEQFNSRIDELCEYAKERNLMTFFVYQESLVKEIQKPSDIKTLVTHSGLRWNEIRNKIRDKCEKECEKEWNELIDNLNSEDRFLDGRKYGKCWTPKFKLIDIKQTANTHNTDYVIRASDEQKTIFPVSLVSGYASQSGYEGKKIEIGEFSYLMFLQDDREAEKVAQILSNTTKRFILTQKPLEKLVSDIISEYTTANPKPVYEGDDYLENKVTPLREKVKFSLSFSPTPSIIGKIISALPGLLTIPLLIKIAEKISAEYFGFGSDIVFIAGVVTGIIFALLSIISGTMFGVMTGILASALLIWFSIEIGIGDYMIAVICGVFVAAIFITMAAGLLLDVIDTKINNNKKKKLTDKEKMRIDEENKCIEEENRRIMEGIKREIEENKRAKEACEKWERGLIDFILHKIDDYFDNLTSENSK